jgi:hypothetical protein
MMPYQCEYVPFDEQLHRIPNRDALGARFEFKLTPMQYVGQPDEKQHVEDRTVRVEVTGPAISGARIPSTLPGTP